MDASEVSAGVVGVFGGERNKVALTPLIPIRFDRRLIANYAIMSLRLKHFVFLFFFFLQVYSQIDLVQLEFVYSF